MTGWMDYWRAVGARITWNRSLLRGAWVVPWLQAKGRLARPAQTARIAYHPHPGSPWYTLPLSLAFTGVRRTRDLSAADAVIVFDDRTRTQIARPETKGRLLNARATDISKDHVGRIFETVFGYPLRVDPTTHIGPMVEKSDVNGVHDGRIVTGPLDAPRAGCSYQRLIDSTVDDGATEDLRCACVGGSVVQVFRKRKAVSERFSTRYLETTLCEAQDVLSAEEQAAIGAFCEAIGLDFGATDVLRDHGGDGRIYIVDVNKTCMPVLSMPVRELELALRRIGTATERLILQARASDVR